ncbi:hypothetical protein M8J75_002279 [Diaphorina citri]|nr:hypothetical protein M8J75_002279 [Diaphorina citri]
MWGFLGNLVIYFQFTGKTYIDADTRDLVIVFINVVVLLGTFLILFLPLYEKEDLLELGSKEICQGGAEADSVQSRQAKDSALIQSIESPLQTLKKGLKIMTSPDVLLLLVLFINIGFSYIFTIVYNTCLGFTRTIPNSIEMLPIAGLMSGFGGMVGGILTAIINPEMSFPLNIRPLMLIAFICYIASYAIAFLNFPDSSIFGYTYDKAYIHSSAYLGIFGSFLLHLAEIVYNSETSALLAKLFPNDIVATFANCSAAITFTGSNFAGLHTQLLCLTGFLLLGTLSFCYVSKRLHRRRKEMSSGGLPLSWNVRSVEESQSS